MKIYVVPITKAKLDKIPEIERAFYVHIGHLRNEFMVLVKLLKWSINTSSDDPILTDVNVSQTFIFSRLLAGKLWEGWQLMHKAYFATKLSLSIESTLPEKAQTALEGLKKYFGKKNLIDSVRNEFAFHYDPQRVRTQLASVEESDDLKIYVSEKSANMFYQMSEIIVGSAMLEAVEPGDFVAATKKFTKEVMDISLQFIDFCDGCLNHMIMNYIGKDAEEADAEEINIIDPPNRDDIQLPFFAK
jgi:hypothetical protein